MSNVSFPVSTHTAILLSFLASLFLLAVIRAALHFLRSRTSSSLEKQTLIQEQPKSIEQTSSSSSSPSPWGWSLFTWDSIPTLPISFKVGENNMKGRGVGLVASQPPPSQPWPRGRRSGPAFEQPRMSLCLSDLLLLLLITMFYHPVPAMYQTEVPVSMAKMIMSRHVRRYFPSPPFPQPPDRLTLRSRLSGNQHSVLHLDLSKVERRCNTLASLPPWYSYVDKHPTHFHFSPQIPFCHPPNTHAPPASIFPHEIAHTSPKGTKMMTFSPTRFVTLFSHNSSRNRNCLLH